MPGVMDHLRSFCAWWESSDYQSPMRFQDNVLATNRICILRVCVPEEMALPEASSIDERRFRAMNQLIEDALARTASYLPFPELPAPIPCAFCSGTGKVAICPDCEDGVFQHCGHEYDCANCRGTGQLKDLDGDENCDECNGFGETRNHAVPIGCAAFNRRYLAILAKLPGIRIAEPITNFQPLYFSSHVGDGAIMGIR